MLKPILLLLSLGIALSAQPIDPAELIDRADLTDPQTYILKIEQIVDNNKKAFLEQKVANTKPDQDWQENEITFDPQKHADLLSPKLAIRKLLTQLHFAAEMIGHEQKHERIDKTRESALNKALLERGLSRDEIDQLMEFANYTYLGHSGIVAMTTQKLEKQFTEDPKRAKDLADLERGTPLSEETMRALTNARFHDYPKLENEAYSNFLAHFSYRSRRVILSYAYERLLQEKQITIPTAQKSWHQIHQEYVQLNQTLEATNSP